MAAVLTAFHVIDMPPNPKPSLPAARGADAPSASGPRHWAVRALCLSVGVGLGFAYWALAPRTFQVKALVGVEESAPGQSTPSDLRLRETVERLLSKEVRARAERGLQGVNGRAGSAREPRSSATVSILDRTRLALEVRAPSERAAAAWPELLVREYQSTRLPPAPADASASPPAAAPSQPPGSIAAPEAPSEHAPATPEMERWNKLRRTMGRPDLTTWDKLAILAEEEAELRRGTQAAPAWNPEGTNSCEALYEQRGKMEASVKQANSSQDLKTFTDLRNQLSSLDARAAARLQAALEWLESEAAKIEAPHNRAPQIGSGATSPAPGLLPSLFYLGVLESRELALWPGRVDVFCGSAIGGLLLALVLPMLLNSIRRVQSNLALLPRRLRLRHFGRVPALCSSGRLPRLIDLRTPNLPARAVQDLCDQLLDAEIDHRPWKTLLLTGTRPSLEKSGLAANLAHALARAGFRTLLMDADIEHGRCHHLFGYRPGPGLTALLQGDTTIDVAVRPSLEPELSLLPAGKWDDPQTLNLSRWSSLLAPFSTYFDRIIIAAPCVGPALDRLGSLKYADATLLLVDERHDDISTARYALRRLRRAGARLAGFAVFNGELPVRADHPARTTLPAAGPLGRETAPDGPLVHLHG